MRELPKGLILTSVGYLQVRLMDEGILYTKNFGKDSEGGRAIATIHLSEMRKAMMMWKAKMLPKHPFIQDAEIPRKRFRDVSTLFFQLWREEKDGDGKLKHTPAAIQMMGYIVNSLNTEFGYDWYDDIKPKDVLAWRAKRLCAVKGTTINREQVVLASLYTHIKEWQAIEKIALFRTPAENFCLGVEKAREAKRERVVTKYEISKFKNAAKELGDENGLENICLGVKTCLSLKDLKKLKFGDVVNLNRAKTGVPVNIPITVLHVPSWKNWRKRWEAIRAKAGLADVEWRDLRKAGANLLLGRHDIKLISMYMGHAEQHTTEKIYTVLHAEKMQALASDLSTIVDGL